jgi:hypothetical protein
MIITSDSQHDAFDNPAKAACRAGDRRGSTTSGPLARPATFGFNGEDARCEVPSCRL